jgi:hypothetical protein
VTETPNSFRAPDWLNEPPRPNEARIYIHIGSEAQIAPEVRDAIGQLAAVLGGGDEVQGYYFGMSASTPGMANRPSSSSASRLVGPPVIIDAAPEGAAASGPGPAANFKVYINWLTGG